MGIIPKLHAEENLGEYGAELFKGSTGKFYSKYLGKSILDLRFAESYLFVASSICLYATQSINSMK